MVKYTPTQARILSNLTPETLRYWKRVISCLKQKRGQGPVFTFGDIFALKILVKLTRVFGLQIGTFIPIAETLFEECNHRSWSVNEGMFLVFDMDRAHIKIVSSVESFVTGASIVLPLGAILRELNHQLTDPVTGDQQMLPFAVAH